MRKVESHAARIEEKSGWKRGGNLVEVLGPEDEVSVVQFIHQTVLEFLMRREKHALVLLQEDTSRVEIITLRTRYSDFLAATIQG